MNLRLTFLVLSILMFSLVTSQDDPDPGEDKGNASPDVTNMFNCNRPGMECYNNATCVEDGSCVCMEDYVGLGCEYNATLLSDSCDTCQNGASCLTETDGSQSCVCTEAYFGDACEIPRAKLMCHPNEMKVMIAPMSNTGRDFSGVIYVQDQAADDGCYLNADPEYPGGFSATLDLKGCGGAGNETDDDGNTDKFFTVLVQYNSLIQTDTDQLFTFACNVLQSGQDQSFDTNVLSSDSKQNPLDKQKVKENLKPVSLKIQDVKGEILKSPVTVGDVVNLRYELNGGKVYDSFKVMEVVATNGLEGNAKETLTFVQDGCVTPEAGQYGNKVVKDLTGDLTGDKTTIVDLKFKAFKFLRSYKLSLANKVKLCKGDGNCNATVCDEFEGLGRRRRAAELDDTIDEENEVYREYNNTIYIYRPQRPRIYESAIARPSVHNHTNMLQCLTHPGFLILFISLIILLVVVVALIALCCVRSFHRGNAKKTTADDGYDNKGYA